MKAKVLFLLLILSGSTAFSQSVTQTGRDSLVYTPLRLMRYMMQELTELDSLRGAHHQLANGLDRELRACRDSVERLSRQYRTSCELINIHSENTNNAEAQLFAAQKKLAVYQKRARIRIVVVGGAALLLGGIIF